MMEEADYARLPYINAHRYASLGLALAWEMADIAWHGPLWIRLRCLLILPLACIWFADQIADHNSLSTDPLTTKLDQDPLTFRWVGWAALLGWMIFLTVLGEKYPPPLRQPPPKPAAAEQEAAL